jgi:hypothetical protein
MIAETNRHAGHADILRELIDGVVGHRPGVSGVNEGADWESYNQRLEQAALQASGTADR